MSSPSTPQVPQLRLSMADAIATIELDNPGRMNAMTAAMWAELPRLLQAADADPGVRVVVVRGAGTRAFSAGADISQFETERSGGSAGAYDELNDAAFRAVTGAVKPTIAMIHGFCLGGGLAIAACCDLRLCDEAAQFSIPPAKLGIGYNQRWVRPLLALASAPSVKELIFTGRRYSAGEAAAMGLVNRILPTEELEPATYALAAEIVANAPLTIRAAKLAIDELSRHPEHPDVAKLDAAVQACFDSADYNEGRRAFLEKRKPQFKGA